MWIIVRQVPILHHLLGVLLAPLFIMAWGYILHVKHPLEFIGVPPRVVLIVLPVLMLALAVAAIREGHVTMDHVGLCLVTLLFMWVVAGFLTLWDRKRTGGWEVMQSDTTAASVVRAFEGALQEEDFSAAYDLCTTGCRSRITWKEFPELAKSARFRARRSPIGTNSELLGRCRPFLPKQVERDLAAVALWSHWGDDTTRTRHVLRLVLRNTTEGVQVDGVELLPVPVTLSES